MLRAAQLGISVRDLDLLTVGLLMDMFIEAQNDDADYDQLATQEDMDNF